MFKIISFGSEWEPLEIGGKTTIEYTEESRAQAVEAVRDFEADMGGT